MRLESNVVVHRSPEEVWAYLGNVSNISEWDRGVAATETSSANSPGVGFEFNTLAHARGASKDGGWGKMSYRITKTDPIEGCVVQLTSTTGNARYFKSAEWRFRVEAVPEGSRVFCAAVFKLRVRYLFMAPVLMGMKKAIRRDLELLKQSLEKSDSNAVTREI